MTSLTPPIRSSKRKRAQVTYYEADSDNEEDDDHESDFSNEALAGPSKKRKIALTKASASRPLPKRKIFPFMDLAAELRNTIYEFTLTAPEAIMLKMQQKNYRHIPTRCKTATRSFIPHRFPLQPKMLQLNKAINSEAQPILYGKNRFWFERSISMHGFLASIGTTNVASLKHVSLQGYSGRAGGSEIYSSAALDYPAMTLLAPAHRLEVFKIGSFVPRHMTKEKELHDNAVGFYRMAYPWLEARAEDAVKALELVEINDFPGTLQSGMVRRRPMSADRVKIFKDELRKLMKSR